MNAAANSPSKSNSTDRCMPHPGQSIPNICLFKQGISVFSENDFNRSISPFVDPLSILKNTIIFGL